MANTKSINLELGSSQSLTAADSASLSLSTDFTLEAWVKPESLVGTHGIMGKHRSSGAGTESYFCYISADGRIWAAFEDASDNLTQFKTTNVEITTGTWYHIAVVADISVSSIAIYVDGDSKAMTSTNTAATSIRDSASNFEIGAYDNNGTKEWLYDGLIDDVRVWSDIRTSTEIDDNKSVELNGDEDNLEAYWKLNNSNLDETANNNDLTLVNSPIYSEDVPFAGATDYTQTCTDAVSITGTIIKAQGFSQTMTETLTLTKASTNQTNFTNTPSESISITETLTKVWTLARTIVQSISLADTVTAFKAKVVSVIDTIITSDVVTKASTFAKTFSQSITTSDAVTSIRKILVTISEVITTASSAVRSLVFSKTITETITIADTFVKKGWGWITKHTASWTFKNKN